MSSYDDARAPGSNQIENKRRMSLRANVETFYPSPLLANEDDYETEDETLAERKIARSETTKKELTEKQMYGECQGPLGGDSLRARKPIRTLRSSIDGGPTAGVTTSRINPPLCLVALTTLWRHTFARLGEDWVFLALLGIIMAVLSFVMDHGISACNNARLWLYRDLSMGLPEIVRFLSWVCLPVCLVLFGVGFVHLVAPQCIGSGIPEMKTILRGVALREYLTFRTLLGKVVGLTVTLGSGMPLGKEGPFVHIASIIATLLGRLVTGFHNIYMNEGRNTEMLAAACAVGVASCFASPIGGVLFSIEVTTVYFAVRNYWRAFFAAVFGATIFRLLSVWFDKNHTVTALFRTGFSMEFPFDPQELIIFGLLGVFCGVTGSLYVRAHRKFVELMRSNPKLNSFFQRNRLVYPGLVALGISALSYPNGLGRYIAADLNTHDQVTTLFSNFTWTASKLTVEQREILRHWVTSPHHSSIFVNLTAFACYTFLFSIIASTLPLPSGSFIPVFKIGAAVGRATGEAVNLLFPSGLRHVGQVSHVVPGGYATVGAAAFSGAVTRTISVSVIVFEMTGQITYLVPIMIAVLVSNAVASLLGPSIYDSIILIKKLPYLPDLLPASGTGAVYDLCVEDFMLRDLRYIYRGITYKSLKTTLLEARQLRTLPLVDNPQSMVLLGSVRRPDLIALIGKHVGRERRLQIAAERQLRNQVSRRPSRFHVEPTRDLNSFNITPKKSILKKTNSFTLMSGNASAATSVWNTSPNSTPYQTVTGAESRVRLAFEAIFRKSTQLQDVDGSSITESLVLPQQAKKVQLPRERVIDMSPEDQRLWEVEEMEKEVDLTQCRIDQAPFQLVERTSLLKVHSLFSLVGISHAYVTATGKLVGLVRLRDLRNAIEGANFWKKTQTSEELTPGSPNDTTESH